MNVFVAFSLVGFGILLDAIHNHIRRESEKRSFDRGYKQGKREEQIRMYGMYDAPMPNYMGQDNQQAQSNIVPVADEAFMEELNNKGRAVKKVQKTK